MAKKAPYGTWESPVSLNLITTASTTFAEILVDPITSKIYHLESRPSENGRVVLVETETGRDIVGKGVNVRTGVHEYGGGPAIIHNGIAYYSDFRDGKVYRVNVNATEDVEPVTPGDKAYRYACFDVHPTYNHLLIAVLEDHTTDLPSEIVNTLHIIDTKTQALFPFISGSDFYAQPKFSPDGKHVTWQEWNHPDMPWDGGRIYVASVEATDLGPGVQLKPTNVTFVAGKAGEISAGYPSWLPDSSKLVFTSDITTGFQAPYVYQLDTSTTYPVFEPTVHQDFALPFRMGVMPHAPMLGGAVAIWSGIAKEGGRDALHLVDLGSNSRGIPHRLTAADEYVSVGCVRGLADGTSFVFIGGKVDGGKALVKGRLVTPSSMPPVSDQGIQASTVELQVLRSSDTEEELKMKGYISRPVPATFSTPDGPVHFIYYPPHNPEYEGSNDPNERPPCVVGVHGGPTGMLGQDLNWQKHWFTSRGWAWLDVNYGGSSGYGKAYRDRLRGQWGVVDVQDCARAAKYVSSHPVRPGMVMADRKRLVIRGGSAGGFTVLATVTTPLTDDGENLNEVFAAGNSLFGVSDLTSFTKTTHKYESHYLEGLLGGSVEDAADVYYQRSPVNGIDRIVSPLLVLQGDIDKVVPIAQAEVIVDGIRKKGGKVEYHVYEGEGHGWRMAETIKDSLERELKFYNDILRIGRT